MDEIVVAIAFIALLFIFGLTAVLAVWTSSLPDEKREELGLGPKGQGK